MNRFVKIFHGYADTVEREINEMTRKRDLNIISVSMCEANIGLYATVIFEHIEESEALLELLKEARGI